MFRDEVGYWVNYRCVANSYCIQKINVILQGNRHIKKLEAIHDNWYSLYGLLELSKHASNESEREKIQQHSLVWWNAADLFQIIYDPIQTVITKLLITVSVEVCLLALTHIGIFYSTMHVLLCTVFTSVIYNVRASSLVYIRTKKSINVQPISSSLRKCSNFSSLFVVCSDRLFFESMQIYIFIVVENCSNNTHSLAAFAFLSLFQQIFH